MKQTVKPAEGRAQGVQIEAGRNDYRVTCHLDDSWSTLAAEAALIERWFGAEIAALFGD